MEARIKGKSELERIQTRLKLNTFKLESLLDITKAINNNVTKEKLYRLFESIVKEQLNIGRFIYYSYEEGWKCRIKYGSKLKNFELDVVKHLLPITDITYVTNNEALNPFDIVIPVYHKQLPLAFVLIGDFDEEQIAISPTIKHLPFIQTLANIISVAAENKKLAKENIQQEAIRKELELAKHVQEMLFPEKLPVNQHLEASACYLPHQEVGGDYYDFIHLNENEVAFCMADVSGKGISAALLMANFQANLRALINRTSSLTELVAELNHKVMLSAKGDRFITFFVAKYNFQTRILNYINAAHLPPILVSNNQSFLLKIGCTGLGMLDEIPTIYEGMLKLDPDALLFFYTDGVHELENSKGEQLGTRKIMDFLISHSQFNTGKINELLLAELNKFRGKNKFRDDVTMLTCRLY